MECNMCGAEFESVAHMLWECSVGVGACMGIFANSCNNGKLYVMSMIMMYILVIMCAAPPILVGAWSMAVLLG